MCVCVCVWCVSRQIQSSPVQSSPFSPVQSSSLQRLRTSPLSSQSTSVLSTITHQTTPAPPGKSLLPRSAPIGPILNLLSLLFPFRSVPTIIPSPPGSGASIGSSQKPAVLPVNDDSTLRVSTLLEAQQRRSPPLLLRWIRPFEACDRGFRPLVVPFLPLPSPRPSCQLGRVRLPRASPHSSCMLHRPPQVLGLDDYCIHSIIWTVQG